MHPGLVAVIPALDEEGSIGQVVTALRAQGVGTVLVADNGSTDRTAERARRAGAEVIPVARRGYGAACQGALQRLPDATDAVLFCDADGADDLDRLGALCRPVLTGELDLVIGSRVLGNPERGALSAPQRFGNWLSARLLRSLFGVRVTDLGPFRCIRRDALERLDMRDQGYGWTVEMQTKALRLGMRYGEIATDARCRRAGTSKISGNLRACVLAGHAILTTIWRYRRSTPDSAGNASSTADTDSAAKASERTA